MTKIKISNEAAAFFESAMRNVELLKGPPENNRVKPTDATEVRKINSSRTKIVHKKQKYNPTVKTLDIPIARDLDARTANRFRRGKMSIDLRLDLHGYRQVEARQMLSEFIRDAYESGARCILVITGKGMHSTNDRKTKVSAPTHGVLREGVPRWLKEGSNKHLILAVESAVAKDGGFGAYYVLLRRKR